MLKPILVLFTLLPLFSFAQQKEEFNHEWEFAKDIDSTFTSRLLLKNQEIKWEKVSLPHTANIEPVEKIKQQWQGICFYRKFFTVPASDKGKHIALQFDAAMQVADVYLNGKKIFNHKGGYLPFYIDVSHLVKFGVENILIVRLDNRDNPQIPPGKLLKDLDFNYYSGIYRNVWLIKKDKLYITNPIAANKIAGGGVIVHSEAASETSASLIVQTEVKNEHSRDRAANVKLTLSDKSGKRIAINAVRTIQIRKGHSYSFADTIKITNPNLWSPEDPYLYNLEVQVVADEKTTDREIIKTGIKTIRFEAGGFYLNGKKTNIRGTNRHQEYPYLGYALSDETQYRDAWKIKDAGFNFFRSSHYPQSPAFLDACDELGILVMNSIPGWQFFGDATFQELSLRDVRDMIRRDRNHPSIVLWEASLNETGMSKDYMQKTHSAVHEELPFKDVYTCGWIDDFYDVFIPARQHAKAPDYWKKYPKQKPLFIAEYGDWEYYAQNAGFNQTEFKDLKQEEKTSRQLRGFGAKRLLQQALNYQESHNDNLKGPAVGDANWLIFDYKRGYADDIESSGIMDIFRIPKFSFYFYQSQRDVELEKENPFTSPVLFVANYWQSPEDTVVKVFSNCQEVELFLNGTSMGKQKPDRDQYSTHLNHPPFTFRLNGFAPGTINAVGYINNKEVVRHEQTTASAPAKIALKYDESGKGLKAGKNDVVFVYAFLQDQTGVLVSNATNLVDFNVEGDAEIIGPKTVKAEAGIATLLLRAGTSEGAVKISAASKDLQSGEFHLTVSK